MCAVDVVADRQVYGQTLTDKEAIKLNVSVWLQVPIWICSLERNCVQNGYFYKLEHN